MTIRTFGIVAMIAPILLTSCASTPKANQPPTLPQDSPTIALVLGGGGAKGFAHIGVIDELEKHGIRPNLVVGTSAGAMVGAMYASGKTPSQLHAFAKNFDETALMDISPSHQGLLQGNKLKDFINAQVGNRTVQALPVRFVAVATDETTRIATPFAMGDTGLVVQASSSVPKLFIPPRLNDKGQADKYGKRYVDGGQSALVPAQIAKQLGADIVISVDVMSDNRPLDFGAISQSSADEKLSIKRDKVGFLASFGGFSVNIPVNFDELPIKIDDKKVPNEINIAIPKQALELAKNPTSIFANLSTAKMSEQDKQASDIIIRPTLQSVSVIDSKNYQAAIIAGQVATAPHILTIKKMVADKRVQVNKNP